MSKRDLMSQVKEVAPEFASTVHSLRDEELKEKLITFGFEVDAIEKAKEDDSDLASKKEAVKIANETYSIPLKEINLKSKLIRQILEERGKK